MTSNNSTRSGVSYTTGRTGYLEPTMGSLRQHEDQYSSSGGMVYSSANTSTSDIRRVGSRSLYNSPTPSGMYGQAPYNQSYSHASYYPQQASDKDNQQDSYSYSYDPQYTYGEDPYMYAQGGTYGYQQQQEDPYGYFHQEGDAYGYQQQQAATYDNQQQQGNLYENHEQANGYGQPTAGVEPYATEAPNTYAAQQYDPSTGQPYAAYPVPQYAPYAAQQYDPYAAQQYDAYAAQPNEGYAAQQVDPYYDTRRQAQEYGYTYGNETPYEWDTAAGGYAEGKGDEGWDYYASKYPQDGYGAHQAENNEGVPAPQPGYEDYTQDVVQNKDDKKGDYATESDKERFDATSVRTLRQPQGEMTQTVEKAEVPYSVQSEKSRSEKSRSAKGTEHWYSMNNQRIKPMTRGRNRTTSGSCTGSFTHSKNAQKNTRDEWRASPYCVGKNGRQGVPRERKGDDARKSKTSDSLPKDTAELYIETTIPQKKDGRTRNPCCCKHLHKHVCQHNHHMHRCCKNTGVHCNHNVHHHCDGSLNKEVVVYSVPNSNCANRHMTVSSPPDSGCVLRYTPSNPVCTKSPTKYVVRDGRTSFCVSQCRQPKLGYGGSTQVEEHGRCLTARNQCDDNVKGNTYEVIATTPTCVLKKGGVESPRCVVLPQPNVAPFSRSKWFFPCFSKTRSSFRPQRYTVTRSVTPHQRAQVARVIEKPYDTYSDIQRSGTVYVVNSGSTQAVVKACNPCNTYPMQDAVCNCSSLHGNKGYTDRNTVQVISKNDGVPNVICCNDSVTCTHAAPASPQRCNKCGMGGRPCTYAAVRAV